MSDEPKELKETADELKVMLDDAEAHEVQIESVIAQVDSSVGEDSSVGAGRPKADLSSLPEDWYIKILELYEMGASDVEVKALIYRWRGSFSNDLWDRWLEQEEQFSETIKTGKLLAESWWHLNGRTNLSNKEFNYTGWYMQMKNRFGWRDKTESAITNPDGSLNPFSKLDPETLRKLADK